MVKELPKLGTWVKADAKVGSIYSCAATDGRDSAIMITHFRDDEATPAEQVKVCIDNVKSENGVKPSGDELKIYADIILQKINSLGIEQ